ncbi:MAG: DUF3025 domain-containing protein [Polyangiaceae bacterium]
MKSPAPFQPRFFESDPLFSPIAAGARCFSDLATWPVVADYGARVAHRAPVTFREQPKKARGRRRKPRCAGDLYDGRIIEEGWVPTRPENWHDFLNMLCWAAFPLAKWQLHLRQHRAISARVDGLVDRLPGARTPELDALALLDEGGIVVACHAARTEDLTAALKARDTAAAKALFASGAARGMLFGHAQYEGLVLAWPESWAAGFVVPTPDLPGSMDEAALLSFADAALAAALSEEGTFQSTDTLVRVDLSLLR